MKKLIWRSGSIPVKAHIIIALAAVLGIAVVESFQVTNRQPGYETKIRAARYMRQGMEIIRSARQEKSLPVDRQIDPFDSGMIGALNSPITSTTVDLDSKLTTINPNWAAVVVDMLKKARVRERGVVAVSFTGSFPAINIAVLSAIKAMKLRPVIITSLSSSTWGANIPGLTWLDMEEELRRKRLFTYKSAAASLGGVKDMALGMQPRGVAILKKTIARHGIPLIYEEQIAKNIDARMAVYDDQAGAENLQAYINVGGGAVSVGSFIGKRRFRPGLNRRPPKKALKIDSIMSRFSYEGLPVINMNYMKKLAEKYGLAVGSEKRKEIALGDVYYSKEYNKKLAAGVLAVLVLSIYAFIKTGIGEALFTRNGDSGDKKNRKPMI